MADTKYKLRYLALFYEDLEQKIVYIAKNLHNEKAANELLDAVERAILERQPVAEAFEPYHSMKERRYPYYRIYVKNFVVWYVVTVCNTMYSFFDGIPLVACRASCERFWKNTGRCRNRQNWQWQ